MAIRIGTRDSQLALWQAEKVQAMLKTIDLESVLVPVKSTGDLQLDKPLYELGITGIFTKTLDVALINDQIDIAVHSMKDVPTALPLGIVQLAVPARGDHRDIIVHKGSTDFLNATGTIATSSLRRKAQWLHKHPTHNIEDLRGNVNTRLQKLEDSNWNGAIFAKAGLERIHVLPDSHEILDWMLPAPAQGALMIVGHERNPELNTKINQLNDAITAQCVKLERDFLKGLQGGCTAPIAAYAFAKGDKIEFSGALTSLDGKQHLVTERTATLSDCKNLGYDAAEEILNRGGEEILAEIRKES